MYFMYCGQSGYFLNKPRMLDAEVWISASAIRKWTLLLRRPWSVVACNFYLPVLPCREVVDGTVKPSRSTAHEGVTVKHLNNVRYLHRTVTLTLCVRYSRCIPVQASTNILDRQQTPKCRNTDCNRSFTSALRCVFQVEFFVVFFNSVSVLKMCRNVLIQSVLRHLSNRYLITYKS
jgi:hypothetical protein